MDVVLVPPQDMVMMITINVPILKVNENKCELSNHILLLSCSIWLWISVNSYHQCRISTREWSASYSLSVVRIQVYHISTNSHWSNHASQWCYSSHMYVTISYVFSKILEWIANYLILKLPWLKSRSPGLQVHLKSSAAWNLRFLPSSCITHIACHYCSKSHDVSYVNSFLIIPFIFIAQLDVSRGCFFTTSRLYGFQIEKL